MKFLTLALTVLVAALALVAPAHAQNSAFAPYVDGGISFSGTGPITSTSNPDFQVGGGIESSTKHLLLDVNAQFDSANLSGLSGLFHNTGGYTGTATGQGYYKIGGKLLVGGGAYWSNQVATGQNITEGYLSNSFNYLQVRPFVGVGYQFKHDRVIVSYVLPGLDQINGLGPAGYLYSGVNSRIGRVSNEIFLGKHFRLTQNVSIDSSNTNALGLVTATGIRTATVSAGVGIKLVL